MGNICDKFILTFLSFETLIKFFFNILNQPILRKEQ